MSNYVYYNGELYHYGVKGMKWGVRKSPEVQAVNKAYKSELGALRRERFKQSVTNYGMSKVYQAVGGKTIGGVRRLVGNHAINKEFKEKKKQLQEKYEPDFQKAKETAEKRLNEQAKLKAETKMTDISSKTTSTGKKVALGVLAGVGGLAVGTAAAYVANSQFKKQSGISIPDMLKMYSAVRNIK